MIFQKKSKSIGKINLTGKKIWLFLFLCFGFLSFTNFALADSARRLPTAYVVHTYGNDSRDYQVGELTVWEQLTDINLTSITTTDQDSSGNTLYVTATTVFDNCELNESTVSVGGQILTITGVTAGVSLTVSNITGTIASGTAVQAGFVLTAYDDESSYADTVELAGATTSTDYFRVIRAADGSRGTLTDGVRFQSASTTVNATIIKLTEANAKIYDVAVKYTTDTTNQRVGIWTQTNPGQVVVGCTAIGNGGTNSFVGFVTYINGNKAFFINCLAKDSGSTGYACGFLSAFNGKMTCYNCTSINNLSGFLIFGGTESIATNCIAQNNATAFNGAWTQTTNATSGVTFEADGYHLSSSDTVAINNGTDLSEDGSFPFDDDIDGDTRPLGSAWDIGVDEAIIQYTLTYSAGANGAIVGITPQTVAHGFDGSAVTADPDDNYHFVEWSDSSTQNPRTDTNVTADISVSASFAIDTHTATFQDYDATELKVEEVNHGNSATPPADPTRTGYTFIGWDIAYNNVTTDLTVTAEYSINNYTVTFDENGGDIPADPTTKNADYNTTIDALPTAPTRTNYTFSEWNTQSDGNGTEFTDATPVITNITVFAIWNLSEHTLTYSANANGTISGTTPQTITHGGNGTEVTAVPDANYHFTTWSDSVLTASRTDTNVTEDISVSASFAIDTTNENEEDSSDTDELDLSNIKYTATDTTITISWKTNNNADSKVKYGKSRDDLDSKKSDNEKEKKHKIILKNLTPETKYFFKIYSEDRNDSEDSSKIYSVITNKTQRINSSFANSDNESMSNENENENQNSENSNQEQKDKKILVEVKFRIIDSQDNPISGIPVTIHSEPQSAITDKDGIVVFRNIEIGAHTLTFKYQNQDFQKNIEITESKTENSIIEIRAVNEKNIKKFSPNWKLIIFGILSLISIALLWFGWRKKLWQSLK